MTSTAASFDDDRRTAAIKEVTGAFARLQEWWQNVEITVSRVNSDNTIESYNRGTVDQDEDPEDDYEEASA